MALTPEEEQELAHLNEMIEEEEIEEEGQKALVGSSNKEPVSSGTSPLRIAVNTPRSALQGAINTIYDADDAIAKALGYGGFTFGDNAENGIIEFHTYKEFKDPIGHLNLPKPAGTDTASTTEKMITNIGSFFVPFLGWSKTFGALKAATALGRIGRGAAAGAVVDFTQEDPVSGNIANVIRDAFEIDNAMLDSLASEEDDEALFKRFKAAAAGTAAGLVADAALEAGMGLIKLYRGWKGSRAEADAIVEEVKRNHSINPDDRDFIGPPAPVASADNAAAASAEATEESLVRSPSAFLDYLEKHAGDDVDDETAGGLLAKLKDGNTADAMARMGIDPAAIDWSELDAPNLLTTFHDRLTGIISRVARRVGRTGVRVSAKETVRAAKALAKESDVLSSLGRSVEGLTEKLTASRLLVESHAQKVMSDGSRAAADIIAGSPKAETSWSAFVESFHRQAYYIGHVTGAASEVGRALRSLRHDVSLTKEKAAQLLNDALKSEESASPVKGRLEEEADSFLSSLKTDADKLDALARLNDHAGDIGELTRYVRSKNMTLLKRADAISGETRGNLFAVSTLYANVLSGGIQMGLRSIAKGLAALGRLTLANPLNQATRNEARTHLLDSWAYTSGWLGGIREANTAVINLLKRELGSELSINLDGLGLKKLAKKAAAVSYRASENLTKLDYVRDDTANQKLFAMYPDERETVERFITMGGSQFAEVSAKAFARTAAAAINAAGSTTRAGTIAFIATPDHFVGTLAARAGARSAALRLAAKEAAEYGLSGKQLSDYLKARVVQYAGDVQGSSEFDAWTKGEREALHAAGNIEAEEILYVDELELKASRAVVNVIGHFPILGNLIIPFVKTPLRILERNVFDYTPLGIFSQRIRKAIAAGGPQRDEALARLGLGMTLTMTALALVEDEDMALVGSDGGWDNTSRLTRPSYSLKAGADVYEISRLDPLGTIMGWAADVKTMMNSYGDDPEVPSIFNRLLSSMTMAAANNILSKTWLQSLDNLTTFVNELSRAENEAEASAARRKFFSTLAPRLIPGAGFQRSFDMAKDPYMREALTFQDNLIRNTLFADTLPVRRDNFGRPVKRLLGERLVGLRMGPAPADPLGSEMSSLGFDIGRLSRTVEGVRLNAYQYSRLKELRGLVVRKENHGLTMVEALTELIQLPAYKSLPRAAKIAEVRREMEGYTRLAKIALLTEDDELVRKVAQKEVWAELELQGATREQKTQATQKLLTELGLK